MSGSGGGNTSALLDRIRVALRSQVGSNEDDEGNPLHFGEVPYSAFSSLESRLAGSAANGQPIADLFSMLPDDVANQAANALLGGLSQGALAIASNLAQILMVSQNRAETIARNELIGSYRDAQMANYRANSDVVGSWIWNAAVASACIACIDMDGSVHSLEEDLIDHVCGRCEPLPITRSWDDILSPYGISAEGIPETSIADSYETGQDWFARQDEATQRDILGPAKYEALSQGDITLDDLLGTHSDAEWGDAIYEKSLKELGLDAQDYLSSGVSRATGLGPQGTEAADAARAAIPEPEPIRVELPGGGYTYVDPYENPFDVQANMEGRETGWQNIDDVLKGLRGEATGAVEEAAAGLASTPYAGPTDVYVQQVADKLENRIAQYAALHPDMTIDDYKAAVEERLQQLLSGDMASSVRVPSSALDSILDDGRLKSSFEADKGMFAAWQEDYNKTRAAFEQAAYGYAEDLAPEMRPISGYITDAGNDSSFASAYGDARLVLTDEAATRSTMTFGDSLDYGEAKLAVPRPVGDVSWDAYGFPASDNPLRDFGAEGLANYQTMLQAYDPLTWNSLSDYAHAGGPFSDMYAEIQIHGSVSVSDIDHIIFTGENPPDAALIKRLEDAGMQWTYEPPTPKGN